MAKDYLSAQDPKMNTRTWQMSWSVFAIGPTWEWSDVEALERRHNIGRGSLILLDYLPQDPLDTYTWRKHFIDLSTMRIGDIETHKESHRPIANNRVYLPMTWPVPHGPPSSSLRLWNFLRECNQICSTANPAQNSGKGW